VPILSPLSATPLSYLRDLYRHCPGIKLKKNGHTEKIDCQKRFGSQLLRGYLFLISGLGPF
jgi:hypothetical protein